MTDIVKRLNRGEGCLDEGGKTCIRMDAESGCICAIAADTILALRAEVEKLRNLRAEVERLRAALERLSCKCPSNCDWEKHGDICPSWVARAALAAGLAAWPGMSIAPEDQGVYLPLPKENTNAES